MAVETQAPYPMEFLVEIMVTQPVAWLGLLGAVSVSGDRKSRVGRSRALAHSTLLLWVLLLFIGSRTAFSGCNVSGSISACRWRCSRRLSSS